MLTERSWIAPALDKIDRVYPTLYCQVKEALQQLPLPEAIRAFVLTEHELAVLRALEWLLHGDWRAFLDYELPANGRSPTVFKVRRPTLNQYASFAQGDEPLLRWALLLHDLAKGREDGADRAHPLRGADIVRLLRPYLWPDEEALGKQVEWLVRYHDVLGNIYTGERIPAFLLEIEQALNGRHQASMFRLLQVVTLCDVRGTAGGSYLTESKAAFWLRLADKAGIMDLNAGTYARRIVRWSGDLLGREDPARAGELQALIAASPNGPLIEAAFGARLAHIVYGFYLFTRLSPRHLFLLMEQIALRLADGDMTPATLKFTAVYRPGDEALLQTYCRQIDGDGLEIVVDKTARTVIVGLD